MQYSVYRAFNSAKTQSVWSHNRTLTVGSDILVSFLCNPSHFGAHVAYKEEPDSCDGHYHLSHPERHVPAVSFGNSAEGKPCHESPHCNTRKMDYCQCWNVTLQRYYVLCHAFNVSPQGTQCFHRNSVTHLQSISSIKLCS